MAYNLVALLVAFLLAITGFADGNVKGIDTGFDGFDLEGSLDYDGNDARAFVDHVLLPRSDLATVTVTETFCGADGPTSLPDSPIISIPETTIMTDTYAPPVPTTEEPTESSPSVKPTVSTSPASPGSPPAPTISGGQTTTLQTSSSSSEGDNGGPTETSSPPTNTSAPTANGGFNQGGMESVILALALTFVRLFGV
ncbi:hypothetical protein BJY00DRAFT_277369 [Aspergillus carlsbadensis]|nr:hypothetical protein BJY00DRAFT_277369 [Aspergillus carlsbadensis]